MNILLYVMAMLMVLSIITYAKLDVFHSNYLLQTLYQKTMGPLQRSLLTESQIKAYQGHHIPKKEEGQEGTLPKPDNEASKYRSKLSLWPLFDPDKRTVMTPIKQETIFLLKRLLSQTYSQTPFFQAIEEEHPGIIETLVEEIVKAASELPKEIKVKSPEFLANLQLHDTLLDEVLYKMLKGNPSSLTPPKPDESAEATGDETVSEKEKEEEISSSKENPFPKLSDYLTLAKSEGVRVYLASKELLTVIFGDLGIADAIIKERVDLWRQAKKGADKKELSQQFQERFLSKRDPSLDPSFLNFTISTTDPRAYD